MITHNEGLAVKRMAFSASMSCDKNGNSTAASAVYFDVAALLQY